MDIKFPPGTPPDIERFVTSLPPYTQDRISPHRIERFLLGEMSMPELTVFVQDMAERGLLMSYGPHLYQAGCHMLAQGLCTINGGYQQ